MGEPKFVHCCPQFEALAKDNIFRRHGKSRTFNVFINSRTGDYDELYVKTCPFCKRKPYPTRPYEGAAPVWSCNDHSCFTKAVARGEQTFTVRAQDKTAPATIAEWIKLNIYTASPEKLHHALDDALRAREWPIKKQAD